MGRGTSGLLEPAPSLGSRDGDGPEDHALVARVRRGDDRAFESLYSRYHRRIHAYVLGMCKDHQRAEDITQEVFVSALRRMRETERPIAFKPWIYEIAKNACIDHFRRSRRAEEVSLHADDGLAPGDHGRLVGSGPTPEAAVVVKQDLDHLCGAFGGLSDVHHEILVMRELEGLSYREIGERLGMSRPAVESTLFRARRRLTEEYEELVSGERCLRVTGIIATAARGRIGARDARRLSRHVAYCQGCRREALQAGLDPATLRRPLRTRVAERVAGLLPFPVLARRFGRSGDGPSWLAHAASSSDQWGPGWSKAIAAAAVLLAGLGGGAATKMVAEAGTGHPAVHPAAQAAHRASASTATHSAIQQAGDAAHPAARPAHRTTGKARHAARTTRDHARKGNRDGGRTGAAKRPSSSAPASQRSGSSSGAAKPGADKAVRTAASTPAKATAPVAAATPEPVRSAVQTVQAVADQTTQAAADVVGTAVDTATATVGGAAQAVGGAVNSAAAGVDSATTDATAPVTNTVRGATQAVTGAVGGLTK